MTKTFLYIMLLLLAAPFAAIAQQNTQYVDGWARPNGDVKAIARWGNTIYIGGDFTAVGFQTRSGLAAIDMTTGNVTSWAPTLDGAVRAITVLGDKVYVGGYFNTVNGQSRKKLVAFDAVTGALDAWNPKVNGQSVKALASQGNTVYAGGSFSQIGPTLRKRLAAINAVTGVATSWNPQADDTVQTMTISGNNLWVGGDFTSIGGNTYVRFGIAAIDMTTAIPTSFSVSMPHVLAIALYGNTVFVGRHGGTPGAAGVNLRSFNATTGAPTSFAPTMSHFVDCITISGGVLYAGGYFEHIDGVNTPRLAAFDVVTGALRATRVNPNAAVFALYAQGDMLYAGGHFTQMSANISRAYFMKVIDSLNVVADPISISSPSSVVCAGSPVQFAINTPSGLLNYQWRLNGMNIPGATNTIYLNNSPVDGSVVDCITTGGASYTSNPITVTVLTPVIPVISSSNTGICGGGSVTITASAGLNYLWNTGAATQSITTTQGGTFQLTYVDSNGCISQSAPLTVQQKTIPSVVKIKAIGPTTLCAGGGVPFELDMLPGSTTGNSYQWLVDNAPVPGATDSTYTANTTGSVKLTVYSSGAGCSKTSAGKMVTIKPLPSASFSVNGATTFCAGGQVTMTAPTVTGVTYTWLKDGVSAGTGVNKTIKASGVYVVVATQNGCKDTANNSVAVTVIPLPVASVSTSDPKTICAGDSATLEAQPASASYTYAWYKGSTIDASVTAAVYEAKTAATYKVMVTDNNGCVSKISNSYVVIKVTLLPTPTIAAQGSTTIPSNGNVKLVATPGSGVTWQWYKDGVAITGATTKNYIVTTGGDYTVAVTKQGCTGISAITTVTQSSVKEEEGVTSVQNDAELQFELVAYPNPVNGVLTVGVKGIEKVDAVVQVMDMNGRLMAATQMTDYTIAVDMSTYANGMYIVRYKDKEGRTGTVKVTKQ